jgi:hypothetical protein
METSRTLTLPVSGRAAAVRRPTGDDSIEAERHCERSTSDREYNLAFLCMVSTVDGQRLPILEFRKLDLADIGALASAMAELVQGPTSGSSPS